MYYNIASGGSRGVQDKLRMMAAATKGWTSERVGRREHKTAEVTRGSGGQLCQRQTYEQSAAAFLDPRQRERARLSRGAEEALFGEGRWQLRGVGARVEEDEEGESRDGRKGRTSSGSMEVMGSGREVEVVAGAGVGRLGR